MNLQSFFKFLMLLIITTLVFSCEEDEVTTNGCPNLAFTYSNEGNDYSFQADFPEIGALSWYGWMINGDVVEEEGTSVNGDNLYEASFSTAGSYEVCLTTETPDCPEGTTFCETIVVGNTLGCPEMSLVYGESPSGHQFTVSFPNGDGPDVVFWTVDGTYVGDGLTYTADLITPGTYEICAGIETPECPNGVSVCHTLTIEGTVGCPEMELSYTDNSPEHQFIVSFPNGNGPDAVFWTVNGTYVGDGSTYTTDFSAPGIYEICAGIETPECPNGASVCYTLTVEESSNDCPQFEITYTQNDSDYVFAANYSGNLDWYGWVVDGEFIENEGDSSNGDDVLNYSFNDIGTYSVCIQHESPTCSNLLECIEVTVE